MKTAVARRARSVASRPQFRDRLWLVTVAGLVVLAGLSSIGGTYAMWSEEATVDGGTLTTGTASLEIAWGTGEDQAIFDNLLPGDSVAREAQLHNSGDVPLELRISAATKSPGFEIRAVAGECTAEGRASVIGAAAAPLTSGSSGGEAVVLRTDESISVCITVTATPTLLPGEQMNYSIDIEGTQVR